MTDGGFRSLRTANAEVGRLRGEVDKKKELIERLRDMQLGEFAEAYLQHEDRLVNLRGIAEGLLQEAAQNDGPDEDKVNELHIRLAAIDPEEFG